LELCYRGKCSVNAFCLRPFCAQDAKSQRAEIRMLLYSFASWREIMIWLRGAML
jgi:hypothetical protein